jgi:hypothetical protein
VSRGFFTIAQGPQYLHLAYGLALSLRLSQAEHGLLSVGVTPAERSSIPAKYLEVFDEVIDIPWEDHAAKSSWKLENEWKAIYMTPYDETIKLDADMLFLSDISGWWNNLALSEGVFCTKPRTYRGDVITDDFYRKTFTENSLPNVYTAMFYFKKTDVNFELFKLAEFIFNNWERCFYEWLGPEHRPPLVSTDVVFAMAAKMLEYGELNQLPLSIVPTFVHMKSRLQGWPTDAFMTEDWTKMINHHFSNDCSLKIGNYVQHLPLHYHVKDFLTDAIIGKLERRLGV